MNNIELTYEDMTSGLDEFHFLFDDAWTENMYAWWWSEEENKSNILN